MSEAMALVVFGGIFALIGVIVFGQTMAKRKKCSKTTIGIVKEVTTEKDASRDTEGKITARNVYHTVVEYKVGEETYLQKSTSGSTINAHYIGEKIEVHYDPKEPTKSYWGTNEFLGLAVGIVFTVVGAGLFIVSFFVGR